MESWLLMHNVCVIPNSMKRASSIWNDYQTHTRVRNWWKKLKNMNLTHFHPKTIENLKRSNILVNIRFVAKTSDIRNFSQNIRSDVKTSEVATLNARIVPIGGKVRFHHSLPFMTKHKPPFGCGPPDRTRKYRIIDTTKQPQQNYSSFAA